jgi:threonine/homoserine/homoserine lactone efflux protein
MTESQILLFLATSLFIIITPGQDLVLVLSRGISQGAKAGISTAAGVSVRVYK